LLLSSYIILDELIQQVYLTGDHVQPEKKFQKTHDT